uniref:Uncharacterized protein n=1 Tax=Anopheles farauti TaxID=69004 RepID=A0A182QPP3_9DIPT
MAPIATTNDPKMAHAGEETLTRHADANQRFYSSAASNHTELQPLGVHVVRECLHAARETAPIGHQLTTWSTRLFQPAVIDVDVLVAYGGVPFAHHQVGHRAEEVLTRTMEFSGSPSQSVLQRKRSQESHPIGGVRASPFSRL